MLLLALIISILVFSMIHFLPGDPIDVMFGEARDPVAMAAIRNLYGLDRPLPLQYLTWAGNLVRGSLGLSFRLRLPVADLIAERLPRTLMLAVGGMLVSLTLAFPAGILAARRYNSWADVAISAASLIGLSMPGFWLALLLVIIFAVSLQWLPPTGYVPPWENPGEWLRTMIMPCVTLGVIMAASTTRMLRSGLLEVLRQEYVRVAHSKGLTERRVLLRHALPNALIPTVTVVGIQLAQLLGGAIVIERVFAYPGMGLLLINAISERDYPLIQASILVFALAFVFVNLVTDITYAFIDPRIRYE
jgi:peptide/nickel transport system permease protein